MANAVYGLDELGAEQWAIAGGKGGTLARLAQAGYPVPEGVILLPSAFEADQLSAAAWAEVQAHLARLRGDDPSLAFAVRSSALAEDSAQASFAGEFETVLGVCRDEEIRAAIHTVRQSRHSERVRTYSRAQGLASDHDMAVIVQRLVPAHLSGVLFTADPVTGSRMRMTGNVVRGLGDRLVSGEITAETFTLACPQGHYQGPPELKCLARKLYRLARRLERDLGGPQDIEWATAGARGPVFLLQSRPVTTLQGRNPATGEFNDSLTGDFLWSNVNFGEAVAEVMTPLSWSIIELTLEEWTMIPGYHPAGNIGGLPYLNLSTYASVFHALGRSREALIDALEGTAYTRLPPGMDIPLIPLSKRSLLTIIPRLLGLLQGQRQAVKALPAYLAQNPAWCRRMGRQIQAAQTPAHLLALWQEEIEPHIRHSVQGVLGSVSHAAGHTTKLRRDLIPLVGADDADALTSGLSDDTELLASLGPLVGLAQVARGEMDRATYLARYGHRGPDEFELSAPRPAEDPAWLDHKLAQFEATPVDVESMLAQQQAAFAAAWDRLQAGHPWQARLLRRRIAQVAPRARLRETARSEYARDRGLARAFALQAGELTGLGSGIFFLTVDEMRVVLSGGHGVTRHIPARRDTYQRYRALPRYPPIIRGRFDPFQWAADPNRRPDLYDARAPRHPESPEFPASSRVTGSPGAAGQVAGRVRRLDHVEEGDQLQPGEVLVTAQANVGWTFLFPRAAAIVTDVGAPLSHAAIVARELGIPAVVGCGDATQRLRTGDRVRVDGMQGTVEILNPRDGSA